MSQNIYLRRRMQQFLFQRVVDCLGKKGARAISQDVMRDTRPPPQTCRPNGGTCTTPTTIDKEHAPQKLSYQYKAYIAGGKKETQTCIVFFCVEVDLLSRLQSPIFPRSFHYHLEHIFFLLCKLKCFVAFQCRHVVSADSPLCSLVCFLDF